LATIVTFILLVIGIPLGWYLSNLHRWYKPILESLVALPIVLPPSVLGFYFLILLSQNSPLGKILDRMGVHLLFTFWGLVVASVIYSLPFMVQSLQAGFESIDRRIIEASYLAGKGVLPTLFRVVLPNMKGAVVTGIVITFAHTIGEFGVVLMVGGAIPGKTEVASVAIYNAVEEMDYTKAHIYSGILLLFSFIVLVGVYLFRYREGQKWSK
jgi:molybdate transport system permease protein